MNLSKKFRLLYTNPLTKSSARSQAPEEMRMPWFGVGKAANETSTMKKII
jgi:hypothetical protein